MKTDLTASLQRRLLFAGNSRLFWDRLASHPFAFSFLKYFVFENRLPQRIPDKLTLFAYDLWECLRTQRRLPCFGEPRGATLLANQRLPQHPNYRIYWNDPDRNVEIGVQLGVDLIRHKGRYYPLELNFDASLKPERRRLYPEQEADPVLSGIALKASQAGYKNVMLFHRYWTNQQRHEFQNVAKAFGVKGILVNLPDGDASHDSVPALPNRLRERTFCVVFQSQHQPLDFFLGDKSATSLWLQEQENTGNRVLATVPSASELFVPPLDESNYWPNLVIKLGGIDLGKSVLFARVRNEAEALRSLHMKNRHDKPRIFNDSLFTRWEAQLYHRDHIVYQQFIPPERTDSGQVRKIRGHFVFTPLRDFFLSAHYVVSNSPLPQQIPFGLVLNGTSLIVNRNQGGYYERVDEQTEKDMKQVAVELGHSLRISVSKRFVTTAEEEQRPLS